MKNTEKSNVIKYRKNTFFNIGTLLFGTVFIYMIITTVMYLIQSHVTSYEVKKGSITGNYRYHALSLRTEEIVNASQSGSIRYYEREGSKTSAGSTVCSINETGSSEPVSIHDFQLNEVDEARIRNTLSNFTINFRDSAFQKTYDLKSNLESRISEIIQDNNDGYVSVRNQCTAPDSGFVIYNIDGFESITEDEINQKSFDQNSYKTKNLRNQKTVTAGDALFKVITDETWYLYFPIDNKLMTELVDSETIRFRFLKDNETFNARFAVIENGGEYFGKITLDNSLVRYVTDRFLEIELVMNKKSGLKIPSSSLVERTFYRIPEEFVIKNEDSETEISLKVRTFREDGSGQDKYVTANVYDKIEDDYLIDQELLDLGDYLLVDNSIKQVKLQEKDIVSLHGVYNINKGYAVFREVTVIDENEEYCIVESNNIYSLAAYDYIVLDASEVSEDQIVY